MDAIDTVQPTLNRELITCKTIFGHEKGEEFTAEDVVRKLKQQGVKDVTEAQVTKRLSYFAEIGKLYESRRTFMLSSYAFPLL